MAVEIDKFLTHRSELVAVLGGLPMLGFTNAFDSSSLCSTVLHHVLPDACPLMSIERDTSEAVN